MATITFHVEVEVLEGGTLRETHSVLDAVLSDANLTLDGQYYLSINDKESASNPKNLAPLIDNLTSR